MSLNRIILVCLTLMALALSGCTQPINDRGMLSSAMLDELGARRVEEGKSVRLFDLPSKPRSRWGTIRYISPIDGVVHGWTLTLWPPLERTDRARVYGRFPREDDVLRGNPRHSAIVWLNDVLFTVDELGRSLIGTPYAAGHLGLSGKLFEPTVSPARAWKRTDTINTWSSGFPADQRTEQTKKDTKHE